MQKSLTDRFLQALGLTMGVALLILATPSSFADPIQLDNRSNKISSSLASAVTNHEIGLTMHDNGQPIGSLRLLFCANSPIIGDVCSPPVGLDLSGAMLTEQSGETGFSILAGSPTNEIILSRPATIPSGTPSSYTFSNIANPSAAGSYYIRLTTYTSVDATGASVEGGGVVFAITSGLSLSTEVPPYLLFCASVAIDSFNCESSTSYLIDLGELGVGSTNAATSQFMLATNAASGYSVFLSGTTLTSGNNLIQPLSVASPSATGVSQFGLNLRTNTTPSVGADPVGPGTGGVINAQYNSSNNFRFQNGDLLLSSTVVSDYRKYTISYITNIDEAQPAGYYTTTLTFICLANF